MAPFIFLVGVDKVHITGEFFAKAESGRSLGLVLCPVKFGLDDEILWAPGVCKVDIFQIKRLEAVLSTCVTESGIELSGKFRSEGKQYIEGLFTYVTVYEHGTKDLCMAHKFYAWHIAENTHFKRTVEQN